MMNKKELSSTVEKGVRKRITSDEFCDLKPRNIFHRQLESVDLPTDEHRNRHILFRKKFELANICGDEKIFITADDYYKLYINGVFVMQGPAMSYHFNYGYNTANIAKYLTCGENTIAVHVYYQGLINRVWQSGDNRCFLEAEITSGGKTLLSTDETFKYAMHTGYTEAGTMGFDTQFAETYDSSAPEVGFQNPGFDDSKWQYAKICKYSDHKLKEQKTHMLEFENIMPQSIEKNENGTVYDFGSQYAGYLCADAESENGGTVIIRCAQEKNADGTIRHALRAKCVYEERWELACGKSRYDIFDYKSFRYAEITAPPGVKITNVRLAARHYPFALKSHLKAEYATDEDIKKVWDLCVRSQKYGVQEAVLDCMEREKGFYLGDGCYTALANMVLTYDDTLVRKLIDDAFSTDFITDTLVTCLDCSFMQEIAEFPLILVFLTLWHYNFTGDKEYLRQNYRKVTKLLDAYRREYETDGLLRNLDKWCVAEWPMQYRHGYDADLTEGKRVSEAHAVINAYYLAAVRCANAEAEILNNEPYRCISPLKEAFYKAFYDKERHTFKDSEKTSKSSFLTRSFVYAFGLCDDEIFKKNYTDEFMQKEIKSLSLFGVFPLMAGFVREKKTELIKSSLKCKGAWQRMISEDASVTFEAWGKDEKWNTSLFHITFSYAAVFMADADLDKLLWLGSENADEVSEFATHRKTEIYKS